MSHDLLCATGFVVSYIVLFIAAYAFINGVGDGRED
jgi:hypothetical protein